MKCTHATIDGVNAIVCGPKRFAKCRCGTLATLECDWKVTKEKTCDAPICPDCAMEVGEDKHLCVTHQGTYAQWLKRQDAKKQESAP